MLISSNADTRGVDAFALSIIKMERQLRRLFTFSVFQYPCFSYSSVPELKNALAAEGRIFFKGFMKGFEAIHPKRIEELIGVDYTRLYPVLDVVTRYRNKIFHGQLTGEDLGRDDLLANVVNLKEWCRLLGQGARHYMNYEGFDDSFRKASNAALVSGFKLQMTGLNDYKQILRSLSR